MASPFNSLVRPKAERKRGLLIIAQLVAIQKISLESDLHPVWLVATKCCVAKAVRPNEPSVQCEFSA
jgi:hypothetical protein